jgi:hypothetical protein
MATVGRQLSDGNDAGQCLGHDITDKLGFYGLTTPIVQPTHADQAAITAGATTTACNTLVIALRVALVNLGLIKGS